MNGCPQHNGESENGRASPHMNGQFSIPTANGDIHTETDNPVSPKPMSQTNKDIVRLIGQHLRSLGLK